MQKPKCFDCKNFRFEFSPATRIDPEYYESDCISELMAEDDHLLELFLDNPDADALDCPGFEPVIIDVCRECGKAIGLPTYKIKYSNNIFEDCYFCSDECETKYSDELIRDAYGGGY